MNAPRGFRRPGRGRVLVAGVALLALAGCNGGVAGLNAQATELLHERVAAVRAAADTDDREAAIAAVEAFKAEVARMVDTGDLTEAQAAGLLAHADAIAVDVLSEVIVPTPTPTPTPSPEPTPIPEDSPAEQVPALSPETADRLAEMLRERLTEYVKAQMEERAAEQLAAQKAAAEAEAAREKAERRKTRDAKRDRNRDDGRHGGQDEN